MICAHVQHAWYRPRYGAWSCGAAARVHPVELHVCSCLSSSFVGPLDLLAAISVHGQLWCEHGEWPEVLVGAMSVQQTRSSVWEYMLRDTPKKGKATCKMWPKQFAFNGSTTTNLWNHVRSALDKAINDGKKAGSSEGKGQLSAFLTRSSCSDQRAQHISQLLSGWCARDVRPISIVEDPGLRDVFRFVEPGDSMPSHTHVTTLLKRKYALVVRKIEALLSASNAVSFTTDIWTSKAVQGFISLTAHHVTDEWKLSSCCVGTVEFSDRHTGVNIAEKFSAITEAFKIPVAAQVGLVHDQAANMELAARLLVDKLPDFKGITRAAHRLQNTIKQGLEVPAVSNLLAVARRLVAHFKHSTVAMGAIRKHQELTKEKKLKFIQDVSTRWNSALHMLE